MSEDADRIIAAIERQTRAMLEAITCLGVAVAAPENTAGPATRRTLQAFNEVTQDYLTKRHY